MGLSAGKPLLPISIREVRRHWLVFVGFYAILTNLPFWAVSHYLRVEQTGWFCLEYACVGLLALALPQSISTALLLFIVVADVLCAVSQSYYISPLDCLKSSVSFLRGVPEYRLLQVCAIVVLVLIITAVAREVSARVPDGTWRFKAASTLCLFMFIVISADSVRIRHETGLWPNPFKLEAPADAVKVSYYENPRLSRVPVAIMIRNEVRFAALGQVIRASKSDTAPIKSAASEAQLSAALNVGTTREEAPNVILILVESWGLASDHSLRDALAAPYNRADLLARYRVSLGTVPFYGATLSGEARELCGSRMGFHLLEATESELGGCLPHRLAKEGYSTVAVHGMEGHFFHREDWYPTVGFEDAWFGDRLRHEGLPDCPGAFTGTCDGSISEWIAGRLESQDKTPEFVYWVTLNSHIPVPVPPSLAAPASCLVWAGNTLEDAICPWYQLVFNVHDSVYRLAMGKLARPTVFIVVGDHAPPFADPALRNRFSSSVVPYVVLTPRPQSNYQLRAATAEQ
jgi:Sulfatase